MTVLCPGCDVERGECECPTDPEHPPELRTYQNGFYVMRNQVLGLITRAMRRPTIIVAARDELDLLRIAVEGAKI